MASNTRIPRTIADFNAYIRSTDDYLQVEIDAGPPPVKNSDRLGLTTGEADDWHDERTAWDELYALYTNSSTRTKSINLQVKNSMTDFRTFATPLLNRMVSNANATEDDEVVFNFKINRAAPTRPTVPISEQCFLTLVPIGGGGIKLSVRSSTDTQRPSIFEGADSFQVAFKIGDTPPANANDGTQLQIFTRATTIQQAGVENSGKQVYAFVRWYLTSYPELAGPWSAMVSVMIL